MSRLRILLVEDHAILREGLVLLIHAQPDMEVVAQTESGRDAARLARESKADLAVVDISLADLGGAEATEAIRANSPATRVVVLTRHADPAYVRRALQAGAAGYVLKKAASETLVHALRTVADGGTYIEPQLAGSLLQKAFGPLPAAVTIDGPPPLSAREEEVLRAIAWGRSNKEIAGELGLSIKTVESYRAGAVEKLGLRTRSDIVRYAVSRGWLSGDNVPE